MKKHFIARLYWVLVFAILPVPQLAAQGDPLQPPEEKSQFHLFLLVGQSNMAGRGKVAEEDRTPHPRVLMLDKAGSWVPAVDPLHFDKPKVVGVGIGKTFGIDYAASEPWCDSRLDSVRSRRFADRFMATRRLSLSNQFASVR